jgi:aldehyde:ferredoxin oxidoreductase
MRGFDECMSRNIPARNIKTADGFETGNTRHEWDLKALKQAHRVLADYSYEKKPVDKGFAGRTLYVNLTSGEIREKAVTEEMKTQFTGGRGFGLKLMWDAIKPTTRWDSEENELVLTSGCLNGTTQYSGFGKCHSLTVSPLTDIICDSNAGGYFAPYMKFSGFDALEIQGKAKEDVVIVLDGLEGRVRVETAPLEETNTHLLNEQLTYIYAAEDTEASRQKVSVVSAGKAAETSFWGCLNVSFYDPRRRVARIKQHGRGGLGRVLRDKGIKAIVARVEHIDGMSNNPVDPERIAAIGTRQHKEHRDLDRYQSNMRTVGTAHLVEIMDAYDLMPI